MTNQLNSFLYHEVGSQKFAFNTQCNDFKFWFKSIFNLRNWKYRLNYKHDMFCPKSLMTLICASLKTLICELGKGLLQSLNLMKKKEVTK